MNLQLIWYIDLIGKQYDLDRLLGDGTDDHYRQQATCWIEDIDPIPFHDVHGSGNYPWGSQLEEYANVINEELELYQSKICKTYMVDLICG